jgi:CubicO group peptidase (beta-lactamase class C family)
LKAVVALALSGAVCVLLAPCSLAGICGDGVIDAGEVCDSDALPGTCSTLGFDGGLLSCRSDCLGPDTSGCVDLTPPSIVAVRATGDRVKVSFSERLDPTSPSTTDPDSYSIDGSVVVQEVRIAADGKTVSLGTSPHPDGSFLLTTSGIADPSGNVMRRDVFPYQHVTVTFPGAAWEPRAPEDVGLDGAKLDLFVSSAGPTGFIARDGYVVRQWNGDTTLDWASAHKPVIATLLMFAVHEGLLTSPDAAVNPFVLQLYGQELDEKDLPMTFRHLTNMVSGYARAEPPSQAWAYNDIAIDLLRSTLTLGVFGESNVNLIAGEPDRLGSLQFEDGNFFKGSGLVDTSPRDFARLGWLWANDGSWDGVPLLPAAMFDDLWRPQVPADLPRSTAPYEFGDYLNAGNGNTDQTASGPGVYGMNAWFNPGRQTWPSAPADTFQANGHWNGEVVTVIPSLRLVAAWVGTSANSDTFFSPMDDLLALLVDAVLPPCPDDDGDGFCAGDDCDEAESSVFPGAPELLDGIDNQCPGEAGYGAVDELGGRAMFAELNDEPWLCWPSQTGATGYEVARAVVPSFTTGCSFSSPTTTCLTTQQDPPPGSTFFYLVRSLEDGEWGFGADGSERDPKASCGSTALRDDRPDAEASGQGSVPPVFSARTR